MTDGLGKSRRYNQKVVKYKSYMITRLIVENYKRFDKLDILFNPDLNIIVGDNESGKSTILECVNLALNFKVNGRIAHSELSSFLFNKTLCDKYVTSLKADINAPLPEILIELYLSDEPDFVKLKGTMNSQKLNEPGVKVLIKFDENYREEYLAFVTKNQTQINTIPIEYYHATWFSFADETITSRSINLDSVMLDAVNIKLQNGTDSYVKSVINNSLDNKQKAELSLIFRILKETFLEDPSIQAINTALETSGGDITEKSLELSLDISQKSGWDSQMIPYLDKIPFHLAGMGEQSSLKLLLTLGRDAENSKIVLIEELENHLSFSTMARLLKRIKDKCEDKQLIITTHSAYVLNKLGIDNLILVANNKSMKLSDLDDDTRDYFEKLPGYDTLRMVLAKKSILVEGPSEELIVQRAYLDLNGHLPIEDGIDIISVRGLSFKRFLDIASLLEIKVSVITDNDGDYATKITAKYEPYNVDENIKIYASENNELKTLEPQIVDVNTLEILNEVLGKNFDTKEQALSHMINKDNKTDCALKIFNSKKNITFPQYVVDAIAR